MDEHVVRSAVEAFMAQDLEGLLAVADPEIELRSLLTEAERPLYYGHEGVRDWFEAVFGVFPDWRPQPRAATHDENGAVVTQLDVTATGAGSGAPVDLRAATGVALTTLTPVVTLPSVAVGDATLRLATGITLRRLAGNRC